jgi:integrase
MGKLTKRVVDAAKPSPARAIVWDDELKGFGLRVEPSGVKTFIIRYRAGSGGRAAPKRFLTVGRYGALTPEEARRKAKRLLGAAAGGKDPAAEIAGQRAGLTFAELARRFLAEHVETKRKGTTADLYRHVLDNHAVPVLGRKKAADVARSDVAKLHHELRETPFLANRVVAVISSMYAWGSEHGLVKPEGYNPASRIRKYKEENRERFLSGAELARLGEALREAETVGLPWEPTPEKAKSKHVTRKEKRRVKYGRDVTAAVRLLLFTGARLREILHLQWEHFDGERGLLLLPDSKTGKKAIVLNAPALAVLNELPRVSPYVVPGASVKEPKPRADLKKPWASISKRAKLDGLRLHDLRHSFASFGAGAGLGLPILGKLLGHTQAGGHHGPLQPPC